VDVVGVSTVLLSVEGVDKAGVELMVRPDDERGTHREASTPPPRARSGRAKILVLMTKRMRGEDNERRREREDAKPRFCKAEKRASTKSFTNKKEQQLKRNQAKKKGINSLSHSAPLQAFSGVHRNLCSSALPRFRRSGDH
jgi:hypothetical protein